jgi:two-component system chemotaxis response regulator CheB
MPIEAGCVYVAPGDWHMLASRGARGTRIETRQDAPENSCRPAVDVLFRSVARVWGGETLALVLTGMGHDGSRGCAELARAGATIVVQDQATSVVWGMPGYVAEAGLAQRILPLGEIGTEIARHIAERGPRSPRKALG